MFINNTNNWNCVVCAEYNKYERSYKIGKNILKVYFKIRYLSRVADLTHFEI